MITGVLTITWTAWTGRRTMRAGAAGGLMPVAVAIRRAKPG
jgi:hypothetical protein